LSNLYEEGSIGKSKNFFKKEKKMKKAMTFSIIFSVMILLATTVFAQPQRRMMRDEEMINRPPLGILHILRANQKELKITDSQLEKIRNLSFSLEEKMIQMRSNISLQRLELRKFLQDEENLDLEKIRAALSKESTIREDIFIERLKTRKQIENILTPEQREALKAMRKEGPRGGRERGLFQRRDRQPQFRGFERRVNK
jgi:Spy/CpxP family protein refolding chaperone